MQKFNTIDEYHDQQSGAIQVILQLLRQAIRQAAHQATEVISYGMPAFKQNKVLVYYAAGKNHIGFYPTPDPIVHFKKELEGYKTSKGAIQFPISENLPWDLIRRIVEFRLVTDTALAKSTSSKLRNVTEKPTDIPAYHAIQNPVHKEICEILYRNISKHLSHTEEKLWHGHPVWFIDGNPIVGYSSQKNGIRLMFWSGADFGEGALNVRGEKFKDASVFYNSANEINTTDLQRWLKKSEEIQWDYKNLIKRKGVLERLK